MGGQSYCMIVSHAPLIPRLNAPTRRLHDLQCFLLRYLKLHGIHDGIVGVAGMHSFVRQHHEMLANQLRGALCSGGVERKSRSHFSVSGFNLHLIAFAVKHRSNLKTALSNCLQIVKHPLLVKTALPGNANASFFKDFLN